MADIQALAKQYATARSFRTHGDKRIRSTMGKREAQLLSIIAFGD